MPTPKSDLAIIASAALLAGNEIVIERTVTTERITIRPAQQSTRCSRCGGTGYPHGREWVTCTACGGSGRIE